MVDSLAGRDWIPKWEAKVVMAMVTKVQTLGSSRARLICIEGGPFCDLEMSRQPHLVKAIRQELGDPEFRVRVEWMSFAEFNEEFSSEGDKRKGRVGKGGGEQSHGDASAAEVQGGGKSKAKGKGNATAKKEHELKHSDKSKGAGTAKEGEKSKGGRKGKADAGCGSQEENNKKTKDVGKGNDMETHRWVDKKKHIAEGDTSKGGGKGRGDVGCGRHDENKKTKAGGKSNATGTQRDVDKNIDTAQSKTGLEGGMSQSPYAREVERFSVRELKDGLNSIGIDTTGCVEKRDLVDLSLAQIHPACPQCGVRHGAKHVLKECLPMGFDSEIPGLQKIFKIGNAVSLKAFALDRSLQFGVFTWSFNMGLDGPALQDKSKQELVNQIVRSYCRMRDANHPALALGVSSHLGTDEYFCQMARDQFAPFLGSGRSSKGRA
eukprot:TRINITY_DN48754_c0_g1_i1.p1 TRINITY_DN48754_c0_g1~~TRINITY_DN48754_c0_g1_i1.p1  ORF type:complete len:492 (-),score=71.14 TRINITY_DN48754_c0_g1_i1:220-1521(-)